MYSQIILRDKAAKLNYKLKSLVNLERIRAKGKTIGARGENIRSESICDSTYMYLLLNISHTYKVSNWLCKAELRQR